MGREIRVAIAGVGNCASALIQGVEYYKNAREDMTIPGLMHVNFGGYHISDVRFVAAFDVNRLKIGKDLSKAIFEKPNCCARFADVPSLDVDVQAAPILDGVAPHMLRAFISYNQGEVEPADVTQVLRDVKADMLINYLPVGSSRGTRFYAQSCLEAGCALINAIPEFIASDSVWAEEFEKKGLPVAGDDVKGQLGATIAHRALVNLLTDRGVKIDETYQLNIGGNTDFLNMTVEDRLKTKRISKTEAITSLLPYDVPVRIGPSDYVPFLKDRKICYVRIRGKKFGNQPVLLDLKLTVEDSPNSAGVIIDVIRAVKLALDRGVAGPLISVSAYAFKHPPIPTTDSVARQWVEDFIVGKRKK
ncbi:MAG: inositol-3-phosphate synthase [Candidatus Bathyarchaeia archaeon]